MAPIKRPFKTWVEISRKSLIANHDVFKKVVGKGKLVGCVVKANAYGHGLSEVCKILKPKAEWFCVDNVEEGLKVRSLGITQPTVVLGYTPDSCLKKAIENDLSFVVYSEAKIKEILKLGLKKKAKVHIKVETGLNRQGLDAKDTLGLARSIMKHQQKILLEGISTHFANIEDTLDPSYYKMQLDRFKKTLTLLKREKMAPPVIHCAASAAALLYPESHFNMVRVGIGLYGLWPSRETEIVLIKKGKRIKLMPVLSWKSMVAQIKNVKAGNSVGYGRTWILSRDSRIAVIPVGYSDGYDRRFSSNSRVLIRGTFAPVMGRVAMNMIVADVTDIHKVMPEDEVVLIGKGGGNKLWVEDLASRISTINYEVVSRINPTIPRIIVK